MQFVDTHCHIDYAVREGNDPDELLNEAKAAGVAWMVNPAVTLEKWPDVIQLAERYPNVFAAAAIHPTDVQDEANPDWSRRITELLSHPKVVAIGETGLDYYWDKSHVMTQHQFFQTFLSMAREHDLPIIIHDRDSQDGGPSTHDDIYNFVKACPGVRGVMHCFSGDTEFGRKMIDLGFYISFAGNLTFKNAKNLQQAAAELPLDRMLIETDTPFLSPMPYRGERNKPSRVVLVAQKIAELRGIEIEIVAEVTTANAQAVFKPCLS